MSLDENQLKYIFSARNIRRYIWILCILLIGLFSVLFIITIGVLDSNREFYKDRLESLSQYKTGDIRLLCNVVSCDKAYIMTNSSVYEYDKDGDIEKIDPKSRFVNRLQFYNMFFTSIIKYKNYEFVIENEDIVDLVVELFILLSILLVVMTTILFYNFAARQYKEELYDKGTLKNYIENKSQRSITEMIHHEMVAPIAVIRSEVDAIYKAIYNEKCQFKRSYDDQVKNDIETINLALCRLDAILEMLRDSKQIKSTDKTISIYAIASNIINTAKCFNIGKIEAVYNNQSVLDKFAIDKISNGMFLNIIQVMVNNSIEAKATTITFDANVLNHNTIEMFVKDNGRGIRDKYDRIIKDSNEVYKYGYSTKNKHGETIIGKSKWKYFLSALGISINSVSAIRGIGLNLNKQLLTKIGGDISVVETSPRGTTFRLVLPIIKISNKEQKS